MTSFLSPAAWACLGLCVGLLGGWPSAHAGGPAAETAVADKVDLKVPLSMEDLRQRLNATVAEVAAKSGKPAATSTKAVRGSRKPTVPADGSASSGPDVAREPEALHWSYAGGGGPADWARLKPEFATCARGERQSPIDIRDGIKVDLEPIKFDYRPVPFEVLDNGHTVQVNVRPGNAIEVNRRRYELVQFHFHRPSEERINGRQFEMVAHLVHKDADGRLAVVAVMIDAGRSHPVIQQVWNSLPLEKNEPLEGLAPIDLNQLLPEDRRYFTYMGSLTTPPCSEGVLWLVLKQPVEVTPGQIGVFAHLYPMNARPLQAGAGRLIKESN